MRLIKKYIYSSLLVALVSTVLSFQGGSITKKIINPVLSKIHNTKSMVEKGVKW